MTHAVVPIHTADLHSALAGNGCDACKQSTLGPDCRFTLGPRTGPTRLIGPPGLLQRVMTTLDQALGGAQVPGTHWVQSITAGDGELEVVLTANSRCAGATLADQAFQALKRQLHDTDLYVRLASA